MTKDELDAAIDAAKDICDPRGHDLLEAIRVAWKHDAVGAEILTSVADAMREENDSHSRHAVSRLRLLENAEPAHDVTRVWP